MGSDVFSIGQVLLTMFTPRKSYPHVNYVLKTNYTKNQLPHYMNTNLPNLVGYISNKVRWYKKKTKLVHINFYLTDGNFQVWLVQQVQF